jgi:hypothetical protein
MRHLVLRSRQEGKLLRSEPKLALLHALLPSCLGAQYKYLLSQRIRLSDPLIGLLSSILIGS